MSRKRRRRFGQPGDQAQRELFSHQPDVPAEAPGERGVRSWMVSLQHFSPREVVAADRDEAIERFKQMTGVIQSDHPFVVNPVAADETALPGTAES